MTSIEELLPVLVAVLTIVVLQLARRYGVIGSGGGGGRQTIDQVVADLLNKVERLERRLETAEAARHELTRENASLRAEMNALKTEVDALRAEDKHAQEQITTLQQERDELTTKTTLLSQERDALQAKVADLERKVADLERALSVSQDVRARVDEITNGVQHAMVNIMQELMKTVLGAVSAQKVENA